MAKYGETLARAVDARIAAPPVDQVALGTILAADRYDGQVAVLESDQSVWQFLPASTAVASAGSVIVPADSPSAGRWVLVHSAAGSAGKVTAGTVHVDMKGAILAAGTPLAAYGGSTPGITLDNSKAVGVRWKGGTLTTVWTSVDIPLDLDPTYPVTATVLISKSGATAADVVSVTLAVYAQTVGALEDAGTNLGAVTPALTSAQAQLAAKTVTKLQAVIVLPPTPPARLSISVTPTGTLATDDMIINGLWLEYVKRPATPRVQIDVRSATLSDGTPMAAWANNAASNPGVTLDNSKDVCVRWNNNATQVPIFSGFVLPADMDVAKPSVLVALVNKSGATGGDTMTLDVGFYEQVSGALEDATTGTLGLGGTTSAIAAPTATAKTVAKLTLVIAGGTFTAGPHPVTVSVQPTSGTLGTDDGILCGFWLEYQKKAATPSLLVDFKAGVLAAGTPMAKWANSAGASAPGVTLNNSKAFGIKWNNFATQTAVWSERDLPLDFDGTQPSNIVLMVSKNNNTTADAVTFDVSLYEQVPGSLEDAGPTFSGTTSALVGSAAAKTCSRLTLALPAATFTTPGRISVSLKPTNGTNATDDVLLSGCWVEYVPKLT